MPSGLRTTPSVLSKKLATAFYNEATEVQRPSPDLDKQDQALVVWNDLFCLDFTAIIYY